MLTDYDGVDVFDADDDKIGAVERTYVDDKFETQFVKIKMGTLLAKHRLVPLDGAEATKDGLHVPFSKKVIQDSPDVSHFDDALDGDILEQVQAYYSDVSPADTNTDDSAALRTVTVDGDDERPVAASTSQEAEEIDSNPNRQGAVPAGAGNGPRYVAE